MHRTDRTMPTLIVFIMLIGLAMRLSAPLSSVMPINDGGLFYTMIQDLRSNHYTLPLTTAYNQANIPFAYPPLAFYLYALIADLTGVPLLDLLRILPAVISILTIPGFYLLTREIIESKVALILAVTAFTFTPRAFDWIIMGGGATRALGLLFALLAMRYTYRLFTYGSSKDILPAILLSSLVVLSHPEAAFQTALSSVFFYLWKDRSRRGFVYSLLIAGGVIIATAPWWFTVMNRHGVYELVAPVTAVSQDNLSFLTRVFNLFIFQFTDEPFLHLFGVLGLIGLFALLAHRQYLLPTWLFLMYIIEPRSALLYMMVPLAIASGFALETVILPALRGLSNLPAPDPERNASSWTDQLLMGNVVKLFLGFIFAYGVMSNFYLASQKLTKLTLSDQDREALEWARTTPTDSRFILITQEHPLLDPSSDWFPALTERRSVATVYGYEWVHDGRFGTRVELARALQNCAVQEVACLDAWQQESGQSYSYVYIRKIKSGLPVEIPLLTYLELSPQFEKAFETDAVTIFHRK